MPRHCPDCGEFMPNDAKCDACGYVPATSNARGGNAFDPDRLRCAWLSNGERCRYFGTISNTTHGTGPAHCRGHYACSDAAFGQRVVEESIAWGYAGPWTGQALHDLSFAAYLARPLPPVPPTPAGVRYPVRSKGFVSAGRRGQLLFPDAEAQAERAAIQGEGAT